MGISHPLTPQHITSAVNSLGGTITVIGDLIVDHFIIGKPVRISREAPVLILNFEEEKFSLGGGANTAANILSLGGTPIILGRVGKDKEGKIILDSFLEKGITSHLLTQEKFTTPLKTRILAGTKDGPKQHVVRVDRGVCLQMDEDKVIEHIDKYCTKAVSNLFVISDYGLGFMGKQVFSYLNKRKYKIVCDSRFQLTSFKGAYAATPNEEEFFSIVGNQEKILEAGKQLRKEMEWELLLLTRGSKGMILFEEEGAWIIKVAGDKEIADVTGAGDTVIAAFSLSIVNNPPVVSALIANYAAGVAVRKAGTATVTKKEVVKLIKEDPSPIIELKWVKL